MKISPVFKKQFYPVFKNKNSPKPKLIYLDSEKGPKHDLFIINDKKNLK